MNTKGYSKNQILVTVLIATVGLFSFTFFQAKPWNVPDAAAKKANPVKSDGESIQTGKELWAKHCQSCHGKKGAGDGTKAAELETEMQDFAKDVVQKQPDGALFYKISEGRDEMPTFKKKIQDESDIWSLVNYMRTLKAK
jgi:mono/diheme cytochrome c family protein